MDSDIVYDWNEQGRSAFGMRPVELHDETFRDGIQCPSVTDPPIEVKKQAIRLMARLGVHSVSVGLPGAGPRAVQDSTELVEMVRDEKLPISVGCAARTHPNDILPIIEVSQKTGVPDRDLHLPRLVAHPDARRELGGGPAGAADADRRQAGRRSRSPHHVRHGRHRALSPHHPAPRVRCRGRGGCWAPRAVRHRGAQHAAGGQQPRGVGRRPPPRPRRARPGQARLARAQRPGPVPGQRAASGAGRV